MQIRSAVWSANHTLKVVEHKIHAHKADEVQIRVDRAAIFGLDRYLYRGEFTLRSGVTQGH